MTANTCPEKEPLPSAWVLVEPLPSMQGSGLYSECYEKRCGLGAQSGRVEENLTDSYFQPKVLKCIVLFICAQTSGTQSSRKETGE